MAAEAIQTIYTQFSNQYRIQGGLVIDRSGEMAGLRGYYSIIQYCPDAARAEVANVGVVLFCPECKFLDARVSERNDRIARFFGRRSFDPEQVNNAKQALVNRLRVERDYFLTPEDLTHFAQTRANEIVLTLPRPMQVEDPVSDLNALFLELVNDRQAQTPSLRKLEEIKAKPSKLSLKPVRK